MFLATFVIRLKISFPHWVRPIHSCRPDSPWYHLKRHSFFSSKSHMSASDTGTAAIATNNIPHKNDTWQKAWAKMCWSSSLDWCFPMMAIPSTNSGNSHLSLGQNHVSSGRMFFWPFSPSQSSCNDQTRQAHPGWRRPSALPEASKSVLNPVRSCI